MRDGQREIEMGLMLKRRVGALEAAAPEGAPVWHRIVQAVGETQEQAIERYGRERIRHSDKLIIRCILGGGYPRGAA